MPAADPVRLAGAARKIGLGSGHFVRDGADGQGRAAMSAAEARATVALAADAGVGLIDTSARWTEAESLIGEGLALRPEAPFRVVAKTAPLALGLQAVEAAARASLRRLRLRQADALVVHASADLLRPEGAELWRLLERLREDGLFARIGLAVAAGEDAEGLARRFRPEIMQVPASLLDPRPIHDGTLERLAARGVEVQLRGVFHRGLLFQSRADLTAAEAALGPRLSRLKRAIAEAGGDLLHAALSFALARPEVSGVIVGVASAAELKAVLAAAAAPPARLDFDRLAAA